MRPILQYRCVFEAGGVSRDRPLGGFPGDRIDAEARYRRGYPHFNERKIERISGNHLFDQGGTAFRLRAPYVEVDPVTESPNLAR